MGVSRADDLHTGLKRVAHGLAAKVEPIGQPVDLERNALLAGDLEHALQVERILRPPVDQPALRMAETAHVRIEQRLLHPLCELAAWHALTPVNACLHPVEL